VSILVNLTILYHLRVRYKNALRITLSKMIPGRTLRDLYVLWLGSPFLPLTLAKISGIVLMSVFAHWTADQAWRRWCPWVVVSIRASPLVRLARLHRTGDPFLRERRCTTTSLFLCSGSPIHTSAASLMAQQHYPLPVMVSVGEGISDC